MDRKTAEAIYHLGLEAHEKLNKIWNYKGDLTEDEQGKIKKAVEIPISSIQTKLLGVVVRQYPDIK